MSDPEVYGFTRFVAFELGLGWEDLAARLIAFREGQRGSGLNDHEKAAIRQEAHALWRQYTKESGK